ncbi:MAG: hypothetical protein IJG84_21825 [Kiritimatiellae bacterium]|nr:hypothetical protein [Kiritimatiellia bacterium]
MNADKLSTGGASPSAESKKREGEKRKSPLTPYREKGKEKGKRENLRGQAPGAGFDMMTFLKIGGDSPRDLPSR